jgi:hypothetical protein
MKDPAVGGPRGVEGMFQRKAEVIPGLSAKLTAALMRFPARLGRPSHPRAHPAAHTSRRRRLRPVARLLFCYRVSDRPPVAQRAEGDRRCQSRRRTGQSAAQPDRRPVKIIPCLDMKEGRVVKGVHFVGFVTPAIRWTTPSSTSRREPTSWPCSTSPPRWKGARPPGMGPTGGRGRQHPSRGGRRIATLHDMEALFELGVAKVSVNSAAVKRPELVGEQRKSSAPNASWWPSTAGAAPLCPRASSGGERGPERHRPGCGGVGPPL